MPAILIGNLTIDDLGQSHMGDLGIFSFSDNQPIGGNIMATNKRVFYAMRRVGIAPNPGGTVPTFQTVRGVQSAGVTTQFRLEQVFELGQLALYENFEGIPEVEITMEKVMDGYCPIYCLATQQLVAGGAPSAPTLAGRAPTYCIVGMQVYDEALSVPGHQGVAESAGGSGLVTELHMSGMYVSSIRYQAELERPVHEMVGFVGNNKAWVIGGNTGLFNTFNYGGGNWDTVAPVSGEAETSTGYPWNPTGTPPNPESKYPYSLASGGGIQRRQHLLMDPATAINNGAKTYCILPGDIPGLVLGPSGSQYTGSNSAVNLYASGTYYINPASGGTFGAHLQNWNIHVDLGREQLHELGRLGNYYRYVNWPVEVVNEISMIMLTYDGVSVAEEGIYNHTGTALDGNTYPNKGCGLKYNLNVWPIRLALCEGLIVDCGSQNKLKSVGMTGGDTGRGNVEVTYTYSTFNDFTVLHPQDVNTSLRP